MKRLLLLPFFAFAAAACGESPTAAALEDSAEPRFDVLESPGSGLSFANEGTGTVCTPSAADTATCSFEIENLNRLDVQVSTYATLRWHYRCVHKSSKKEAVSGYFERIVGGAREPVSAHAVTGTEAYPFAQPPSNPCEALKGPYTMVWNNTLAVANWRVNARDVANSSVWICKSSNGSCTNNS